MSHRDLITEWFEQYSNDVYNFLVYYRGSKDVHDLVQETFIRATRGINTFRYDANPKTWLFSIARNVAIDQARKKKRRIQPSSVAFDETYMGESSNNPESQLIENERVRYIYQQMMTLRRNYREVLILRGIEGMSIKETAEILDWTESKVKQTFYRARKALQKRLNGKGEISYGS